LVQFKRKEKKKKYEVDVEGCINSTLVQFKPKMNPLNNGGFVLCINSTLVQFKQNGLKMLLQEICVSIPLWFNSNSKIIYQKKIKKISVSIPLWFNSNILFDVNRDLEKDYESQFHFGSIQTIISM